MQKYIIANWKMQLNKKAVTSYLKYFQQNVLQQEGANIILCPSFVHMAEFAPYLKGSSFFLGGQDCAPYEQGAYTGDISAAMLQEYGASYVLIGHSERRQNHQEKEELLADKIKRALEHNIRPVYCVGEPYNIKKNSNSLEYVIQQIESVFKYLSAYSSIILAYEPVWAIGSGQSCSTEDIEFIHQRVKKAFPGIPILYGGSVTLDNVKAIMSCSSVDGTLVGGASLNPQNFHQLILASI